MSKVISINKSTQNSSVSPAFSSITETVAYVGKAVASLERTVREDADGRKVFFINGAPTDEQAKRALNAASVVKEAFHVRATTETVRETISVLLSCMKLSRAETSPSALSAGLTIGLQGVSKIALSQAVEQVIRGEGKYRDGNGNTHVLSNTFIPTPAELRQLANSIENEANRKATRLVELLSLPVIKNPYAAKVV